MYSYSTSLSIKFNFFRFFYWHFGFSIAVQINWLVYIWRQHWHLMINWPNFIGWLPLLLEILGKKCSVLIFLKKYRDNFLYHILCMIFQEKILLMSYQINWHNFIVWLPLLLKILGNLFIVIICFTVEDVTNSEINFLIKSFLYVIKNVMTNFSIS